MKILLAAKCPPNGSRKIGGVQSWCLTVGNELIKRGHSVTYWGPGQRLTGRFDLGILANWDSVSSIANLCDKRILISHGIIPAEKPHISGNMTLMFTSEGVKHHWNMDGTIIRQPIDLDFWCPDKDAERIYLTRFSYRNGIPYAPNVAKNLHLKFIHVKNENQNSVREILRKSACVLATGRASLEAMACGVPVVLCDHRSSYQGPLMDLNLHAAMKRNYSGRGGITPNAENLLSAVDHAMDKPSLRNHVKRHHNVIHIVDKLLGAACFIF